MKHKTNLGLNAVHSVLKEKERQEQKEQEHQKKKMEMHSLGLIKSIAPQNKIVETQTPRSKGTPRSKNREKNPETAKKNAETTKNVILKEI